MAVRIGDYEAVESLLKSSTFFNPFLNQNFVKVTKKIKNQSKIKGESLSIGMVKTLTESEIKIDNFGAFEIAALIGDVETLKIFTRARMARKFEIWRSLRGNLESLLTQIPDFELQIRWSCDSSWIPFL